MKAIVDTILAKAECVQQATTAYLDDIYIHENILSTAYIRQHLTNFGLMFKDLEQLENNARIHVILVGAGHPLLEACE